MADTIFLSDNTSLNRRAFLKKTATAAAIVAAGSVPFFRCSRPSEFDIIIKGGTIYDGTLSPPFEAIPERNIRRHLEDIKKHGFNAITYYGRGEEELDLYERALSLYKEYGFKDPLFLMGWGRYPYDRKFDDQTNAKQRASVQRFLKRSAEKNLPEPVFYHMDEPSNETDAIFTKKRAEITREAGGKTCVSFCGPAAGDILLETIDFPNMEVSLPPDIRKAFRDKSLRSGHTPLYYCQIWGENPRLNRLMCGFFLRNSGYKGFFHYVYQALSEDPYFDADGATKDLALAYPSREGPVPTLQWEAAREGIYDYMYAQLLDEMIQKIRPKARRKKDKIFIKELEGKLETILGKYDYDAIIGWGSHAYWDLVFRERDKGVPNRQFREDRERIARMITELGKRFQRQLQ